MNTGVYYDRYGRAVVPGTDAVIQPRCGVFGIITTPDDHVLLTSPPHVEWHYEFPGGGIETGETMHEALVREIYEETGVTLPDLPLGRSHEQRIAFYAEDTDAFWDYQQTFYDVRLNTTPRDFFTMPRLTPEGGHAQWVPLTQLGDVAMQEMHKPACHALLS